MKKITLIKPESYCEITIRKARALFGDVIKSDTTEVRVGFGRHLGVTNSDGITVWYQNVFGTWSFPAVIY